jgi:hypothetical protein
VCFGAEWCIGSQEEDVPLVSKEAFEVEKRGETSDLLPSIISTQLLSGSREQRKAYNTFFLVRHGMSWWNASVRYIRADVAPRRRLGLLPL